VPLTRIGADPLVITVTSAGSYLVNGREVLNTSAATLRLAIVKLAGERRDRPATIRADARATHQAVVTAMDTLGRLGFGQLRIVTTNSNEPARS
jgi:biopolymer transport protein ExbD